MKIIWNITNQCKFHCEICATHSDRAEISPEEKEAVLKSILSIGEKNIEEIDFSGGDPLYSEECVSVIQKAALILGKEKVCVTTTGAGIAKAAMRGDSLSELLYNCELTIDGIEGIPNNLRHDDTYYPKNMAMAVHHRDEITNLIINVPILNPNMVHEEICNLVDAIVNIRAKSISVNLIRLMNTGKAALKEYTDRYEPARFVSAFQEYAKSSSIRRVSVHCALRGFLYGEPCAMLERKIGIDCAGNVFACAWGGYVKGYDWDSIAENPFFLGNLLEKPLADILRSERCIRLRRQISQQQTCHCRVFCYKEGDPDSIFVEQDTLFQKQGKEV